MKQLRILHCPHIVGGNPAQLARAERELGLASRAIIFKQNYLQYKTDEVLLPDSAGALQIELKRFHLLWRALREFDVIHFNFGESLMPKLNLRRGASLQWLRKIYQFYVSLVELRDLPLLKRAGKGIFVTYQGDDARQGDFIKKNFAINIADEVEENYYSPESDHHKRLRIVRFAAYADRIYALNPDLLHLLPAQAQFLPYAHIDLSEWQPASSNRSVAEVPVVVHAPSHRGVKGTRFVLDAVARLRAEGVALEFILVEGLSNAAARKIYEKADLLVDQLLAGWYGGLAVELMALGKPVICYIRAEDLKFIPPPMRTALPLINATPATIYETLKLWLTVRKGELPEIGQRSRSYVETWHDQRIIAAKLKQEYEAIMSAKARGGRR